MDRGPQKEPGGDVLGSKARGNFTDSGFKSAEKFRRNLIPFQVK